MLSLESPRPPRRTRRAPAGIIREDSDDELGLDDHPWEWVYAQEPAALSPKEGGSSRKRKRVDEGPPRIVGARMGSFECALGDTVLLKADGSNEAWVGIICDFQDEDDGAKSAHFMWFSSEREIRNKHKKRTDHLWNELYITPSWDHNPLESINGKAKVMSLQGFQDKFPTGKVPKSSRDHGKVFVCRRGCNTRTATYTDEFTWEDIYRGPDDISNLVELVKNGTKATRKGRGAPRAESPDALYDLNANDGEEGERPKKTPKKMGSIPGTPRKARVGSKPATPSSHRK